MTKQDLQKFYDAESAAIESRIKAEAEFIEEHGLEIGTKVKLKRGYDKGGVGIIVKREIRYSNGYIEYQAHKIKKNGEPHKTASLNWWMSRDEFEVIK